MGLALRVQSAQARSSQWQCAREIEYNGLHQPTYQHECTRMCTARLPDCEKAFPHVEHSCGRSPLCTRMCTARWPDVEKALPHVEHSCGRSPLCTRMCSARLPDVEKALPHVEH